MKKLVVYYSFEGNTKFIAETIAQAIGADILELKPKKDIETKGFMKFIWGGRQVVMKNKPELLPFDKDPAQYDLLFIGTPVWAFAFAPALRTFFDTVKLKDKKIALFCTHEGTPIGTLANMEDCLTGNRIAGKMDFNNPLHNDIEKNKDKAAAWAKQIIEEANK